MPSRLKYFSALTDQMATNVGANRESWMNFLDTAARLYKYPFPDQLLIYAQRPDAIATAPIETWNETFNRWVIRGSKGIGLIDDTGNYPKIRYVFDVNDTEPSAYSQSRPVHLWEMREEHKAAVLDALGKIYDDVYEDSLMESFGNIADQLAKEYYDDNEQEIRFNIENSLFENFDESTRRDMFEDILSNSVAYTLAARCGISTAGFLNNAAFHFIHEFNTQDMVFALGTATSDLSQQVLRDVEIAVKKFERQKLNQQQMAASQSPENEKSIAIDQNISHEQSIVSEQSAENVAGNADVAQNADNNQNLNDERSSENEHGNNLHANRGLPTARPEIKRTATGDSGISRPIRENEESISQGTQDNNLQQNASERNLISPPSGDRGSGNTSHGAGDEHSNREEHPSQQGHRPDGLDGTDEHLEIPSGGDGAERTGVRLLDEAGEKSAEPQSTLQSDEDEPETPLAQEAKTSETGGVPVVENNQDAEISKQPADTISADFTELHDMQDGQHSYSQSGNRSDISPAPTSLIMPASSSEPTQLPGPTAELNESLTKSSITIDEIDAILRDGGNDANSTLRIAAHCAKSLSNDDNATFLRSEYLSGRYDREKKPGSKGYQFGSEQTSLWFDESGLIIGRGKSAISSKDYVLIPWEQAAERIKQLYDSGHYVSHDVLEEALYNESKELGNRVVSLYQDISRGVSDMERSLRKTMDDSQREVIKKSRRRGYMIYDLTEISDAVDDIIEAFEAADDEQKKLLADDIMRLYGDVIEKSIVIPSEWGFGEGYNIADERVANLLHNKGELNADEIRLGFGYNEYSEYAKIVSRLRNDVAALDHEPDTPLRFYQNPRLLLRNLEKAGIQPKGFPVAEIKSVNFMRFITDDEVQHFLTKGSNVNESKFRILSHFLHDHTPKERVDFLKNEYGHGGRTWLDGWSNASPGKGIQLQRKGCEDVQLNWNNVTKMIGELISNGQYMTQEELGRVTAYEELILARSIKNFYRDLQGEYQSPFPKGSDFQYPKEYERAALIDFLGNPDKIDKTLVEMRFLFSYTSEDDRYYNTRKIGYERLLAYHKGTYTLFPGIENMPGPDNSNIRPTEPPALPPPSGPQAQLSLFDDFDPRPVLPSPEEQKAKIEQPDAPPLQSITQETEQPAIEESARVISNPITQEEIDALLLIVDYEDMERLASQISHSPKSRETVRLIREVYGGIEESLPRIDDSLTDDYKEFIYMTGENNGLSLVRDAPSIDTEKNKPIAGIRLVEETIDMPWTAVVKRVSELVNDGRFAVAEQEAITMPENTMDATITEGINESPEVPSYTVGDRLEYNGTLCEIDRIDDYIRLKNLGIQSAYPIFDFISLRKQDFESMLIDGRTAIIAIDQDLEIPNVTEGPVELDFDNVAQMILERVVLDEDFSEALTNAQIRGALRNPLNTALDKIIKAHEQDEPQIYDKYFNDDDFNDQLFSFIYRQSWESRQKSDIVQETPILPSQDDNLPAQADNLVMDDNFDKEVDSTAIPQTPQSSPPPVFFVDWDEAQNNFDLNLYKDRDLIGYNKDGVEYKLGRMGTITYIINSTGITPWGDITGATNIPRDIWQQMNAYHNGELTDEQVRENYLQVLDAYKNGPASDVEAPDVDSAQPETTAAEGHQSGIQAAQIAKVPDGAASETTATTSESAVTPSESAIIPSISSQSETQAETPRILYREYLPKLVKEIEEHQASFILINSNTNAFDAMATIRDWVENWTSKNKDAHGAFCETYISHGDFANWLHGDIFRQTFHDAKWDGIDFITLKEDESDSPDWIKRTSVVEQVREALYLRGFVVSDELIADAIIDNGIQPNNDTVKYIVEHIAHEYLTENAESEMVLPEILSEQPEHTSEIADATTGGPEPASAHPESTIVQPEVTSRQPAIAVGQPDMQPMAEKLYDEFLPSDADVAVTAYYLFHHPSSPDIPVSVGNEVLPLITERAGSYVFCGDTCTLSDMELEAYNITFRQMPRDWNLLPDTVQEQLRITKPVIESQFKALQNKQPIPSATTSFPAGKGDQLDFLLEVETELDAYTDRLRAEVDTSVLQQSPDTSKISTSTPKTSTPNHRITNDHLGEGGAKTKFRYNIDAVNLLHDLEFDKRSATPQEQEILARYVGWGSLPQAFDLHSEKWSKEHIELEVALSPDEYDSARASTLNAHYTSPTVIKAIYEAVERMGFKSGNILEPACGVGNFFGLLPESMADSKLYGVELDNVTARIAKQLYPKANIQETGFENTEMPDNFFDLAIGNVPFGDYGVYDKKYDKHKFKIHDYFFAKSLDQVRPGGIVAFITSKGTLDKANPDVRKYLAQRADLLGAVRLPNNAFLKNAGTEVTADIIFLQKREKPMDKEPDWVHLGQTEDGLPINSYFVDNPEMVLGKMSIDDSLRMYGNENITTCVPIEGADLGEQLRTALFNIQGQITEPELDDLDGIDNDAIPADPRVKNFSYALVTPDAEGGITAEKIGEGQVYFRENSLMYPVDLPATTLERIKGMVAIRDCTHELITLQVDERPDDEIRPKQDELNKLYDNFTKEYGLINSVGNKRAFNADSSYFLLCSLEILDEDNEFERKADMFTKRTIKPQVTITRVDTASEALAVSLSEKGHVDLDYMESLTGFSYDKLVSDLKGVIFLNIGNTSDQTKAYVTADEYLSGNVRKKLVKAIAAQTAIGDGSLDINVSALEAVQPKHLEAHEIAVRLGSTWIDTDIIQQFVHELLPASKINNKDYHVKYSPRTGEWRVTGRGKALFNDIHATVTYGTSRMNAYQIIDDTLNLRDVRVYDYIKDEESKDKRVLNKKETTLAQQKQEMIKQAFQDWIWQEPERRHRLVKLYNEKFNSTRPREFDGSHLKFPGMSPEVILRPHQVNAIARVMYGGNTLLAHVVGGGKTFTMTGAAMEMKRIGLCHKSLIVVPNHLTEQWATEFLRLYPAANILVARKKDFEMRNRKKFCAKIATGEYDAVIIGHSQLEKIPLSKERQRNILDEQINEIEDAIQELAGNDEERFTIKQMERTKRSLELHLSKLLDAKKKDDVVTFEQLGVDRLFIDESHFYKNLFMHTKMRNVAGISQQSAQKSIDLFTKTRYMDEITGNKGNIHATGTPITNTLAEMYTNQRYLQYDRLIELGLTHFDAWASTFAEPQTTIELAPEGTGYRARTRLAKFHNLPELLAEFRDFADIQTADMLDLPTPDVNYVNIILEPSEIQQDMVQKLSERAALVQTGKVDPKDDNMLKITTDGRKIGLDQRLMNPLLPESENSKTNACADIVFDIWDDTKDKSLTQLVFCDFSTPKKDGRFNIYEDIKDKLIEKGIPEYEIAFIHDYESEARKKELFAKVRKGKVRVLFGSTAKMGAGTNVQDKLIATHDADCPWRPAEKGQS